MADLFVASTFGLPAGFDVWLASLLLAGAFLAGFIDAVVGGGGLVQIPLLFALFPFAPPAVLLGTNKIASVFGTSASAVQYARRVAVEWNTALPAALAALVSSFAGAWTVTRIPPDFLRALLPFLLVAVAAYTYFRKDLGSVHEPAHSGLRETLLGAAVGASIGFYDGFFGPGTGSFLVFLFVRFFGFDFLGASAAAKVVNVACNLAAIVWFAISGNLWLGVGLAMAAFNVAGSLTGSHIAISRGSSFVRRLFLAVVSLLVLKTAYDAFLK